MKYIRDFEVKSVVFCLIMYIITCSLFMRDICTYIVYLKQNAVRDCSVAAILYLLFTVHITLFIMLNILYFTSVLATVCVQCPIWLFSVIPWFRAFPVCCSGILWMILRGLSLLFYIPHALYFYCKSLYILESSRLPSLSHFCFLKLQHTCSFFIIRDYDVWFIVHSTMWLPFYLDLFPLILVYVHISVLCQILCLFRCIFILIIVIIIIIITMRRRIEEQSYDKECIHRHCWNAEGLLTHKEERGMCD